MNNELSKTIEEEAMEGQLMLVEVITEWYGLMCWHWLVRRREFFASVLPPQIRIPSSIKPPTAPRTGISNWDQGLHLVDLLAKSMISEVPY